MSLFAASRRRVVLLVFLLATLAVSGAYAQVFTASQDAYTSAVSPGSNFGSEPELRVKSGSREGYWFFDLGSLAGGTVTRATLRVHVQTFFRATDPFTVHQVLVPWDEAVLTHNNRPTVDPTPIAMATPPGAGSYAEIDVASLVAQWVANPSTNQGLAILPPATGMKVFFSSRESGLAAELEIELIGGAKPNFATVKKTGGDYSDPVAAVNDVDTWCDPPGPPFPESVCRLLIGAGIFMLSESLTLPRSFAVIGAGRNRTQLVTQPGVENSIHLTGDEGSRYSISDLSIQNIAGTTGSARGIWTEEMSLDRAPRVEIRNVSVEVRNGTTENVGLGVNEDFLTNVDVTVSGGTRAAGILSDGVTASDVRVAVNGNASTQEVTGWVDAADDFSPIIERFNISASGGLQSTGLRIENRFEQIAHGYVSAGGTGIFLLEGAPAVLADIRVIGTIGIDVQRTDDVLLDDTNIIAQETALRISAFAGDVNVTNSVLSGRTNSIASSVGGVRIGLSQLAGPIAADPGFLTCVFVFDENFLPLTCP